MTKLPAYVVALGASNTAGYGVPCTAAYPSVLETLLRARGFELRVTNAGISGNTAGEMLARLDADVPADTRVVIFQPGSNDVRRGIGEAVRERNINLVEENLRSRSITVVRVAAAFEAARPGNLQGDGIHYTERGHELIAQFILKQVADALVQLGVRPTH